MQKSRGWGVWVRLGVRGKGGCEPRIEVIVKMQKKSRECGGGQVGRGVQVKSGDLVGA